MANVGKNIRLLRTEKGMTQDALAELLYVSRQTVSNYENGRSNPDIDMLVKIAEALETDVNILIFGRPVPPSRKREWRKLLCGTAALLFLGVLCLRLEGPAAEWRRDRFDFGPLFALHMLLRPAVYLVCGWTVMQAVSLIWGVKRQHRRSFQVTCEILIVLLCLYMLISIPFCAERLAVSCQLLRSADRSDLRRYLPDLWNRAAIGLWNGILQYPFVFLPAGLVLWNGRGRRSDAS